MTKRIIELKKVEQYKSDARSSVWRVVDEVDGAGGNSGGCGDSGGWVVKRFEYWSVRQVLGLLIGMHPGQFECRRNRKLRRLGVNVVAVEESGLEFKDGRFRYWLATGYAGVSLQDRVKSDDFADSDQRRTVLRSVGELFSQLVRLGLFFRDFKASNVVVGDDGVVRLIDVGGCRGIRTNNDVNRMIGLMETTLGLAGASEQELEMLKEGGISQ